jgi:CRP-like cAMP-binding protein
MIHKEYSLSKTFYLQLARALEFVNKRSRHGIEEFVKDLPGALGNNVLIVAYEKILSDNFFFEKKSTDFVAWVAPRLKFYRVEMNEIIYSVDDYAIQMYFITRGVVEFVLFRIQRIIPYYELEGKYYFGEIDLLFSEDKKHLHSTRAGEVSEMLTLSRENFILLLNTFEVEAIDICGKAKERLERINEKLQDTEIKIKNNDFSIEKRKTYPQQADFMYFDKIRRSIKTNESQDLDKKHSQNLFKKIIESKKRIRYHHGKDIKNKVEELEKETTALKEVLIDLQNAVSDKYPKFVKKIPIFSPDTSSNESYVSSNENDLSVN